MHNSKGMKRLNSETHLGEDLEDDFFLKHLVFFSHVLDSMS